MADAPPGIDPDLLSQLNGGTTSSGPTPSPTPAATSSATATSDSGADIDQGLLNDLNAAPPPGAGAGAGANHQHAPAAAPHHAVPAPTQYKQTTAPPPASAPELTLAQAGQQALQNAPQSIAQGVSGMVHGIGGLLTGETERNVGHLAAGFGSQLGLYDPPDAKSKAKNEALAKAVENHYANYLSWKGIKQNLATDPFGMAMDLSMVTDPAAGVLGKLGEAGQLGALSSAARIAGKTLTNVNPVTAAINAARLPGKVITPVARQIGAMTSGVPSSALKLAQTVGAHGDPAVQGMFTKFAKGAGNDAEGAQMLNDALDQVRADNRNAYLDTKKNLKNAPVNYQNTYAALDAADQQLKMGDPALVTAQQKLVDQIRQSVDGVSSGTINPNDLLQADVLKQQIWDFGKANGLNEGHLGAIYHGLRDDISAVDPEYANLMENYKVGRDNINDLQKTFGLGKNAAASGKLVRSFAGLKTAPKTNLLQQLINKDPRIGGMLAGMAAQPWTRGNASLWETAMGAGLPAYLLHPAGAVAALPGAAAGFIASSPKLVTSAANVAGKTSRALNAASSIPAQALTKGAYYASRPDALQTPVDTTSEAPASPAAPAPASSGQSQPGDLDRLVKGVSVAESGGARDPYHAVSGVVHGNDHAYGKYQVLGEHIPSWTKDILGRAYTPEQFMADPEAQDVVATTMLKRYLLKYGNWRDAAAAWNSGVPLAQAVAEGRQDRGQSVPTYTGKVAEGGGFPGAATGGRIGFADGGQVSDMVDRLMSRAGRAQKASQSATKPLLGLSDDTIAKALAVAGRTF